MSGHSDIEPSATHQACQDEPLYFQSGNDKLFAWLHRPADTVIANTGVVICKPFGYEALCSHRTLRAFAEEAAVLGLPALRFDYLGTGDSADMDSDADQLEAWVQDAVAAVHELRRRTGVERVCLVGFRFGALLATLAATRSPHVSALVLIAPVIAGQRYLRELRTTRLAALMNADFQDSHAQASNDFRGVGEGSMEFSGYFMSAATMKSIASIDLSRASIAGVSKALIIDRLDLPVARTMADSMCAAGVATQYLPLPGFVEMALVAPQFSAVPQAILAATREWLPTLAARGSLQPVNTFDVELERRTVAGSTDALRLPCPGARAQDALTERPVVFGSAAPVFGIVSEPREGEVRRRGVILLNAGADNHMGPGRMYVSLARAWASHGYFVLRMDLAGLGDSGTRPGRPDNEVFPPAALDDIRDAIELLRMRYGIQEISLTGLCSGAYHALRAAVAGLTMNRVLMVNPQNYFWRQGMSLERLQLAEVVRNPVVYRERVWSKKAWKRLLTGEVNVWRIVQTYLHRPLLTLESSIRDLARQMRIRLPRDLGWELEEVGARGLRVVFVFARGEPGIDLLKIQGGSALKRLGDRCRVHIIDSADHTFTRSGPRAAMVEVLSNELFARHVR